ncbi:MAG: 16S rRNA (uracil(1498)-N(3))-methyltransferase [Bacteroidales bacterium]|jgi:16S rRNA (uracil1498-N3)-methyltransferase|nr:16S rRNA (uracil(1498)-N(3))-methyltransferase [Bacteroidales bacterium]
MIFYTPDIADHSSLYVLNEEESAHAVRVLRMKANDALTLVDGRGGRYDAMVEQPHPKHCEVRITSAQHGFEKRESYLHIGIAPTKNMDRLEWFVEKATEIGIDAITPLLCEHSERKKLTEDRLQRVAISAMKQSGKAYLPKLYSPASFAEWVQNCGEGRKMIACCGSFEKQTLSQAYRTGENAIVAIGPEGDFSPNEVKKAIAAGFECITLGKSRLRTETAGVVVCCEINFINEE